MKKIKLIFALVSVLICFMLMNADISQAAGSASACATDNCLLTPDQTAPGTKVFGSTTIYVQALPMVTSTAQNDQLFLCGEGDDLNYLTVFIEMKTGKRLDSGKVKEGKSSTFSFVVDEDYMNECDLYPSCDPATCNPYVEDCSLCTTEVFCEEWFLGDIEPKALTRQIYINDQGMVPFCALTDEEFIEALLVKYFDEVVVPGIFGEEKPFAIKSVEREVVHPTFPGFYYVSFTMAVDE